MAKSRNVEEWSRGHDTAPVSMVPLLLLILLRRLCCRAVFEELSRACRSFVLAYGLFRGRLGPEEALWAARVEEEFQVRGEFSRCCWPPASLGATNDGHGRLTLQIDLWGMVEGGHDIDRADMRVRLSSASVLLRLIR